jgi:acetyl-CoA acetyltransferase
MRQVVVVGVGMTKFGKFLDRTLQDMGQESIWNAVEDAGIPGSDIEVAYFSNSLAGLITGQEAVRGQVVLRYSGFGGIPIINVENACASGTTAFRGAWLEVASGAHDVALAVGVEKLFCNDTARSIRALATNSEIELARMGFQFTAYYALQLRKYMKEFGATKKLFAQTAVKNSCNGSLNPYAQHQKPLTVDEVLNSRPISDPLTLYMCSSMSDGAAAAILTTKEKAREYTTGPLIEVAACVLRAGMFRKPHDTSTPNTVTMAAREAYETAGIGPDEINLAEVHDAMAPVELLRCEELLFCEKGGAIAMFEQGRTQINGDLPVDPSGGLSARGHPVGATGLAQVAEIVWQLRGTAGARQVAKPKVGLTQNSGGRVEEDTAATSVTILKS